MIGHPTHVRRWLAVLGWTVWAGWCGSISGQDDDKANFPNTQPLAVPFTPAEKTLDLFDLPEGFNISLFAAEPDIQQPIAVTTDQRGRLWVVECYTYSDRTTNYDMTMKDRIVILEDTDGDGQHDTRTVFWDRGEKLTGIEVGMGGVWLTSAPNFIFIPDRDGDDQPDGPPEILLDGFEDDVIRHNIVNGLRWGPDGWLYGRHGIQATSFVGPPGSTESQRTSMNCSIWRYHPVLRKFEIVAQGGTNPWGFDFDEHGEMFMINTVIGHLFHVVPGARYERMYGAHFNPHTYQVIAQTADHLHFAVGENWSDVKQHGISNETDLAGGGHAHTGLMIYLGGNWPSQYHNSLFTANFHGRRLNRDTIERKGNGYVGRHAEDLFATDDPWFRGVEMVYGPDGGVFLLDWSDIGECHENDGIHRTSGRIYKIVFGDPKPPTLKPMNEADGGELVAFHQHDNEWYFRKARRELQERAFDGRLAKSTRPALRKLLDDSDQAVRTRLRALWSLYSIDALTTADLIRVSTEKDEHLRSWAVRLLADGNLEITEPVNRRLIEMAEQDRSGLVRLYLASSLSRLDADARFQVAAKLAAHVDDAGDTTQPSLIWYGIEPLVIDYPARAVSLVMQCKIPQLRENVLRRLAFENESVTCRDAIETIVDRRPLSEVHHSLIVGLDKAFAGWTQAIPPKRWPEFSKKALATNALFGERIDRLNLVFGDGASIARLRTTANDADLDSLVRSRAIESIANSQPDDLFAFLKPLANDKVVLTQVVKSLVHCPDREAAALLISKYGACDQDGKRALVSSLVARPEWARQLLEAIENKQIPGHLVSAWHARKIYQFNDDSLTAKLAAVWGEVRQGDEQRVALTDRLRAQITPGQLANADRAAGRALFEKNCATCHVLFGKGSRIGPDLTGSDRKNLNYLLENLVDPSALVAESYQMKIYLLKDGRTISGLIVNQNSKTVEIQTPEEIVTIERDSIEDERKTKLSLMPDGLLDKMTEKQRADLFAFLMTRG